MITLAPGDLLQAVITPNVGGVYVAAMGEIVPVGGGLPQAGQFGSITATSGWQPIAAPAAGQQMLVNHINVSNTAGQTIGLQIAHFIAGGGLAYVIGNQYVYMPSGQNAWYDKNGWHMISQASGVDSKRYVIEGVCQGGSNQAVNVPQAMVWNGALQNGTNLAASTSGLTVNRTGVYVVTAGIRWGGPGAGNRFSALTIGGGMTMNDYMQGGIATGVSPGHTLAIVQHINVGNLIGVNLWTDTATSIVNGYLTACWIGPAN